MLRMWLLPAVALTGAWAQPEVSPIPPERRADAYAVYSAVLARPDLAHADTNTKYLVVNVTGMAQEGRPDSCIAPPAAYRGELAEIMDDYRTLRDKSFRLEREFSLAKPYELLTPVEGGSFMDPRRDPPGPELQQRFSGATDLITLGNVYFNRKHTLAAVKTWAWCGTLCGRGAWRVLEKTDGRWEDRNWIHCMVLARGGQSGSANATYTASVPPAGALPPAAAITTY